MFISIRRTDEGRYFFILKSETNEVMLASSQYSSLQSVKNDIKYIKENFGKDTNVFDNTDTDI